MRLSVAFPDWMDAKLREIAEAEGQISRGAVIRKALSLFLTNYASKSKHKQNNKVK